MTENVNNRHGNGLVLILLALSIAAIFIWLFTPFIAYCSENDGLFLSLLICISTYAKTFVVTFLLINSPINTPKISAAVIMTLLVTVLLILPLGYILLVSGIEITALINKLQSDYQVSEISRITDQIIMGLPISDSIREFLDNSLRNNLEGIAFAIKDFSIVILKSITTLSSQFIFFVIITIFSLYYFYVDGPSFIDKVRSVSPLDNKINDLILNQFSGLSLTSSWECLLSSINTRYCFCNWGHDCWVTSLIFWRCNGTCKLHPSPRWGASLVTNINLFICNR